MEPLFACHNTGTYILSGTISRIWLFFLSATHYNSKISPRNLNLIHPTLPFRLLNTSNNKAYYMSFLYLSSVHAFASVLILIYKPAPKNVLPIKDNQPSSHFPGFTLFSSSSFLSLPLFLSPQFVCFWHCDFHCKIEACLFLSGKTEFLEFYSGIPKKTHSRLILLRLVLYQLWVKILVIFPDLGNRGTTKFTPMCRKLLYLYT